MHKRIARKYMQKRAYEASGAFEKVVGHILTRELGLTGVAEDFFKEALNQVESALKEEGMEMDLHNPDIYPTLKRVVYELVDDLGIRDK